MLKAAKDGDVDSLKYFIRKYHGTDEVRNSYDEMGQTPLLWALENGHLDCVRELLAAGANPKDKTAYYHSNSGLRSFKPQRGGGGGTNPTYGPNRPALHLALGHHNTPEMLALLLEAGAREDVNAKYGTTRQTVLHCLARRVTETPSEFAAALTVLRKHGANPNLQDAFGNTPLHFLLSSCMAEDEVLQRVIHLLDADADPNVPNHLGDTPLHEAVQCGYLSCVRLLLSRIDHTTLLRRNYDEHTPLEVAQARLEAGSQAHEPVVAAIKQLVFPNKKSHPIPMISKEAPAPLTPAQNSRLGCEDGVVKLENSTSTAGSVAVITAIASQPSNGLPARQNDDAELGRHVFANRCVGAVERDSPLQAPPAPNAVEKQPQTHSKHVSSSGHDFKEQFKEEQCQKLLIERRIANSVPGQRPPTSTAIPLKLSTPVVDRTMPQTTATNGSLSKPHTEMKVLKAAIDGEKISDSVNKLSSSTVHRGDLIQEKTAILPTTSQLKSSFLTQKFEAATAGVHTLASTMQQLKLTTESRPGAANPKPANAPRSPRLRPSVLIQKFEAATTAGANASNSTTTQSNSAAKGPLSAEAKPANAPQSPQLRPSVLIQKFEAAMTAGANNSPYSNASYTTPTTGSMPPQAKPVSTHPGSPSRTAATSAVPSAGPITYVADAARAWTVKITKKKIADITVLPGTKFYSYSELKLLRKESGIDMGHKEMYLSSDEFCAVFKMNRASFNALPTWRRFLLKKKVGLW